MTVIDTELTLDTWLDLVTQPESEEARLWHPGWSDAATPVRSVEHLTVLVSSLDPEGDFAGVTVPGYRRWVQIKRLDARCWVEGQAETGDWPWVFLPKGAVLRRGGPARWTSHQAAEIAWAWLDGRVLEGVVRVPAASS